METAEVETAEAETAEVETAEWETAEGGSLWEEVYLEHLEAFG